MASYDPSFFYYHFRNDGPMMLENLVSEDTFDFQINIFLNHSPSRHYFPFFVDFTIIPSQHLPQRFPLYLQQNLSNFLSTHQIQILSSEVISYTNSLLNDEDDHHHHHVFPLIVDIAVFSSNNDDDEEEEDRGDLDMMIMDRVVEASMREVSMTPASEEAIASLKKVEEKSVEICSERCSICLEDFGRDDDVSGMPCEHVFHRDCVVGWLKISHTCPLCRFQMS